MRFQDFIAPTKSRITNNELQRYQPKEPTLRGLIFGYLILENLIKDYKRLLIKSLRVIQQSCERQDFKRYLVLTLLLQL